jgi:hypothetical protein
MVVDAGFGPHRKQLMSTTIVFNSLSGCVDCFNVEDIAPPDMSMSDGLAWDNFGRAYQAVLYIIGNSPERYVGGILRRDHMGQWQRLTPFQEFDRSGALLFCSEHAIDPPRKLLASVRDATKPDNVTPESTVTTQPKPENLGEGAEPPKTAEPEVLDYVTLRQAAAMVKKTKRTLEGYKSNGLPLPVVEGGGGRADYYEWRPMRLWLAETFGWPLDKLPEVHPHTTALLAKASEDRRKPPRR